MRLSRLTLGILIIVLPTFCVETRAQAQLSQGSIANIENLLRNIEIQSRNQEVLLRTLTNEIKQHILTSQINNINLYRLQTLNVSLNNQQVRVDSISTELDLLDEQFSQSSEPSSIEQDLRTIEEQISQTSDPGQRAMLTSAYNTAKRSMENEKERLKKEKESNRVRHQNLTNRLQAEKLRLSEIEESLLKMDKYFQEITDELATKRKP
jgi:hypothetical protein